MGEGCAAQSNVISLGGKYFISILKIFAGSEHAADQPAPAAQHRAVPRRAGAQADRGGDGAGDNRAAAREQGGGRYSCR